MKNFYQFYVYLLASNKNGTLYIGFTNDLQRRIQQHKLGLGSVFTSKYEVYKLVYFETFQFAKDAIQREKQLKKWNRAWEIELIEKEDKDWNDLAKDWFDMD